MRQISGSLSVDLEFVRRFKPHARSVRRRAGFLGFSASCRFENSLASKCGGDDLNEQPVGECPIFFSNFMYGHRAVNQTCAATLQVAKPRFQTQEAVRTFPDFHAIQLLVDTEPLISAPFSALGLRVNGRNTGRKGAGHAAGWPDWLLALQPKLRLALLCAQCAEHVYQEK